MFTGIISACTPVTSVTEKDGGLTLAIKKPKEWDVVIGESININGVCSTIVATTADTITVEYMPETIRRTTVKNLAAGSQVNLERTLTLNDRLSGHLVTGHVDSIGTVDQISTDGNAHVIVIQHDATNNKYIINKGSVTINGVSLTVINPTEHTFSVAIIPKTWHHTNIQELSDGGEVNIEYDQVAKYIAAHMEKMTPYGT